MNSTELQTILAAAQARLAADQPGALDRSGMPSPLAYLSLAVLDALAALDDPGEVSDLLGTVVGKEHRKALLTALRDPMFALRAMVLGDALSHACAALIEALDGAAPVLPGPPTVHQEARATSINNLRQVVAEHYHEAADEARAGAERALADYLRSLQHTCGTLQLGRLDHEEGRHRNAMRLEQVYISLNTERQVELTEQEQQSGAQAGRRRPGEEAKRPVAALEALNRPHPARLLLLGAPAAARVPSSTTWPSAWPGRITVSAAPSKPNRLSRCSHGYALTGRKGACCPCVWCCATWLPSSPWPAHGRVSLATSTPI